jgi:hypothetical protein
VKRGTIYKYILGHYLAIMEIGLVLDER